jgi:tetratricopeptide (TPR) repeat protein
LKELGNLFAANGQKVQALERYQEALRVQEAIAEKHPEMSQVGPGIGDILEKISALEPDSDKAIEILLKAVDYQAKALLELRGYQMFEGFMENHWVNISGRLPRIKNPRLVYPKLLKRLYQLMESFPDYRKYQDFEIQIKRSYAWFLVSSPCHTTDDYEEAAEIAKSALIFKNDDEKMLRTLGMAQYRSGLFTEALKTIESASLMDQPGGLAFLAMCQFKLNKKDEAMESFNRLIKAMEKPSFSNDEESRNFFREASNLIQPMTIPEQPFQD